MRNRSCKGVIYNNPLICEDNLVEENILKKKKKLKRNEVRRNASNDFLNIKNCSNNYKENIYNKNNSNIISDNIENIKENLSNKVRVSKIKKQLEDILPPFEFEKIFKNRLPSANIGNNRKKNNVNVKININNNYNYINNVNLNNNNQKYNTENQYQHLSKNNKGNKNLHNIYDIYYNNKKSSSRPKSTSSIITNDNIYKNNYKPPPMLKISNNLKKSTKNNLTDINDNNYNNNINKDNVNSNKKYKDFYNLYYQKFIQEKLKNHNNSKKIINFNQNNEIGRNNNSKYDGRKIVYEKIKVIHKQGEERKYIKGPSYVRCVGEGNVNNQCHRAILKYQYMLNNNNDYSIQNFINKDFKNDKTGPRIIIPKKMLISN